VSNIKVLVVEDDEIVARSLQRTLELFGYSAPFVVSSGEEAVERVQKDRPDIVLMDIVLEGDMDGVAAADLISARYGIPVIFITAYDDDITLKRVKKTLPYGYITKPFKQKELLAAIEIALEKARIDKRQRDAFQFNKAFKRSIRCLNEALSVMRRRKERFTTVRIRDVIEAIRDNLLEKLPPGIRLEVALPRDPCSVLGDYRQIYGAIENLCVTACDAMPEGGRLTIFVENTFIIARSSILDNDSDIGPYVVVTIEDSGKGFSFENTTRLFELFSCLVEPDDTQGGPEAGATGPRPEGHRSPQLRDETVYAVLKDHGGFINIFHDSEKGTRVQLFLPSLA